MEKRQCYHCSTQQHSHRIFLFHITCLPLCFWSAVAIKVGWQRRFQQLRPGNSQVWANRQTLYKTQSESHTTRGLNHPFIDFTISSTLRRGSKGGLVGGVNGAMPACMLPSPGEQDTTVSTVSGQMANDATKRVRFHMDLELPVLPAPDQTQLAQMERDLSYSTRWAPLRH